MAEHVWSLLCYKNLVDPDTGVVSLIDVAEQLFLQPFEETESLSDNLDKLHGEGMKGVFFPAQIRVITHWVRTDWKTPEEATIRFTVVDPSGEVLLRQESPITLMDFTAQRLALRLDRFYLTSLGHYWFVVERPNRREEQEQWEVVARIPLEVLEVEKSK